MKEIVVISGKGGTGKTSITASFAYLGGNRVVVADCDVDAADMHLLLKPRVVRTQDFFSSQVAAIDNDICTDCGECMDVCRFDAIEIRDSEYFIKPLDCEGCGYCSRICPVGAIELSLQNDGQWFISKTNAHNTLVHAKLGIGAENSGKLVAKVKNKARQIAKYNSRDFVIVDGSPGIGCPVVSSLSGADFVVLVTEPSVSGLHDLKRVYQLIKQFNIKAGCIINKHDLNPQKTKEITAFLKDQGIENIARLPYDEDFTKAMTLGKTIMEYSNGKLADIVADSWEKIKNITSKM